MIDHYKILGVPRDASPELIKKTYVALQKIYHPDVYIGDKKFAKEKIQEINTAYEILSSKIFQCCNIIDSIIRSVLLTFGMIEIFSSSTNLG